MRWRARSEGQTIWYWRRFAEEQTSSALTSTWQWNILTGLGCGTLLWWRNWNSSRTMTMQWALRAASVARERNGFRSSETCQHWSITSTRSVRAIKTCLATRWQRIRMGRWALPLRRKPNIHGHFARPMPTLSGSRWTKMELSRRWCWPRGSGTTKVSWSSRLKGSRMQQ